MKAKNSLRAMLWPLLKQVIRIKYRLSNSRKPKNAEINPFNMDLEKVAADGKRIADKLREMQRVAEQTKLQNKRPATNSIPAKEAINNDNTQVLCGWREDEDDRYRSVDYFSNYQSQPHLCDDNREMMRAVLHAFFKTDHDAAQYEQYRLESDLSPPVQVRKAVSHLKTFVGSGLRVLVTVIVIMGAGSARLKAQDLKAPQALKIGDRVPDITIQNIINYKSKTAKISDFKGKLLILDFWATWCSPCIAMIPKTDTLQRLFAGKVQFMPVTYQSTKEISAFVKKLEEVKNLKMVTASGNTELANLFPHKELPHYVWIDQDGIVKAITGYQEVNTENISKMLESNAFQVRQKHDISIQHDRSKPLLVGNNGGDGSELIYHSVLARQTEGLSSQLTVINGDSTFGKKVIITNSTLPQLFKVAFREYGYFGNNRIIIDSKNRTALEPVDVTDFTSWRKVHTYNYELIVPVSLKNDMLSMMQADLARLFPQYHAVIEKRNTMCLVLVRTSKIDKLISKGQKSQVYFDAFGCTLINYPLSRLIAQLNVLSLQKSPMPVVDDSGYKGKVDISLNANLSDVTALNQELNKYDLRLEPRMKEINMLVIKDKSN